jgi:hypothetical protein
MTVVAVRASQSGSCLIGINLVSVIAISAFFRGTSSIYPRMAL